MDKEVFALDRENAPSSLTYERVIGMLYKDILNEVFVYFGMRVKE